MRGRPGRSPDEGFTAAVRWSGSLATRPALVAALGAVWVGDIHSGAGGAASPVPDEPQLADTMSIPTQRVVR
jgi:hypothetical protein